MQWRSDCLISATRFVYVGARNPFLSTSWYGRFQVQQSHALALVWMLQNGGYFKWLRILKHRFFHCYWSSPYFEGREFSISPENIAGAETKPFENAPSQWIEIELQGSIAIHIPAPLDPRTNKSNMLFYALIIQLIGSWSLLFWCLLFWWVCVIEISLQPRRRLGR